MSHREATRRAALGAGAKVIQVFGYRLNSTEVRQLAELAPDVILLAGGTDGGDAATILANARAIAAAGLQAPLVVAGSKSVGPEVVDILQAAGKKDVRLTANVLPELNRLNIEPARQTIRKVFIERIIEAKGLQRARGLLADIVMPTPMYVRNLRIITFTLGAAITALGGGLFAHFVRVVSPVDLGFAHSMSYLIFVAFGGSIVFWGPVVGAFTLTAPPELLRFSAVDRYLIYGALLVLIMIFRPGGLVVRRRIGEKGERT